MHMKRHPKHALFTLVLLATALLWPPAAWMGHASAGQSSSAATRDDGDDKQKKKRRGKRGKKRSKQSIRWGQRRKESDKKYDKRYAKRLRQTKKDAEGDTSGGVITDGKNQVRLWTYMGHPFIVRTDISREFTADTAMYMEMLHRAYGKAYKKILGVPASVKERIEVIVYADRSTYMANGGAAGSGGSFTVGTSFADRPKSWPALHYRLAMFTGGEKKFHRWEKGKLKHEAAHMEMRMRLGMKFEPRGGYAIWVESPNWFEEGQATIFEYWDFDKTVEENLKAVPRRGRYAPAVRRMVGTDHWKPFDAVWNITNAQWGKDMETPEGFLNYGRAWSLAAYMMTGGRQGRKDFRAIFDLSRRVGIDSEGKNLKAWNDKFSHRDRARLDKNWRQWAETHVSRDKRVPHEDRFLILSGYNPAIVDRLAPFANQEEFNAAFEKIRKAEERRRNDPDRIEK